MVKHTKRVLKWLAAISLLSILVISLIGCSSPQQSTSPSPSPTTKGSTSPSPTGSPAGAFSVTDTQIQTAHSPLTLSQIANIQPGLGTVMIEYSQRFNNLWFAAQKNNWAMVSYQIDEMREIQEVGETTRANRATPLKAFEAGFLDPMAKAVAAKDLAAFTTAYDAAITGCNACHAGSSGTAADGSPIPSYKFVKIIRPTAPDFNNVDWAGQ